MIEGAKLTLTGEDFRKLLGERIEQLMRRAQEWRADAERPNNERSGRAAWMPDEDCEDLARTWEWRAQRLEFIREHIDPSEVYRLGPNDVKFTELLPPKPEPIGTWNG